MACLIGIDIGTTGTKALAIDENGRILADALAEYPLKTPKPNWAEQDPADWWQATVSTLKQLLQHQDVSRDEIAGIGLSGQMHGSVFLDADNEVIRPAILWCDQRTSAQCQWISEKIGEEQIVQETCNPVLTGFTAPKIIWVRQNEPNNYDRTRTILLPKDYIRFKLTGEFATEVSDASGTSLLNVEKRQWSQPMLDGLDLSEDMLPEVYESPEVSGRVTAAAAELTGLPEETMVVGGGGDQAAGAVGNGIVEGGIVSSTTGTSGVVFAHLDELRMDDELRTHTFCHAVPGKWHVMGVMLAAGGSLRWFRDALCASETAVAELTGKDPYEYITAAAAQAPRGAEGLIFLPYMSGERTPYPNPNAKGVFFGLHLRHDKRHIARAILEGVAYGLCDCLQIIKQMGVSVDEIRASGGGARSELWRQIQADVTGHAHYTINVDEGPAFGAALLAGVGASVWETVPEACDSTIDVIDEKQPVGEATDEYEAYRTLYTKLYEQLEGSFDQLQQLMD